MRRESVESGGTVGVTPNHAGKGGEAPRTAPCYHGGAFFDAIGPGFEDLRVRHRIINADVLDAWFDPAPGVLAALTEHLPWLLRTSPPARCEGMLRAAAGARGVDERCVLPGAGSSDLIFRVLPRWLGPGSRVLILDPMYGEYAHMLEHVVGCRVDRWPLRRGSGYQLDCDRLAAWLNNAAYDLVILVNPNSPTGRHVPREDLERLLNALPEATRVWIDETYVEYVGREQSLERFAAASENTVVCKSMSKVYALSGARAGYLIGPPRLIEPLHALTPPWAVSLPAQLAAVEALKDPGYYEARYRRTHELRNALAAQLRRIGLDVIPGTANFLLCHLPPHAPTAAEIVSRCRRRGVFLRDASGMGTALGPHALRVAVKDATQNDTVVRTLTEAMPRSLVSAR